MSDRCVFFSKGRDGILQLVVAVYVDDVIIAGSKHAVEHFKKALSERFDIQSSGALEWYLGIAIQREEHRTVIHQK
jgi:hypothetical protein